MHNQYIQQLTNFGIIGLLLYIYLLTKTHTAIKYHNLKYLGAFWGMVLMGLTLSMSSSYKPLWILLMMAFVKIDSLDIEDKLDG